MLAIVPKRYFPFDFSSSLLYVNGYAHQFEFLFLIGSVDEADRPPVTATQTLVYQELGLTT
jgi:hypothetical protein